MTINTTRSTFERETLLYYASTIDIIFRPPRSRVRSIGNRCAENPTDSGNLDVDELSKSTNQSYARPRMDG